MSSKTKILIFAGLAIIFILFLSIKGCNKNKEDTNTQQNTFNKQYEYSDGYDDNDYNNTNAYSGYLNDYYIEIVDYRFSETEYSGDPLIVITYNYTNYSDEANCFSYTLEDTVFQNGIELEQEYFSIKDEDVDNSMASKKIQPGTTLTFEKAYELQNDFDDVDVEVTPLFSYGNEKVTRTFYLE
ncbi:MAG: DUF5067 domain-containing protein [Ruminococcus sp.]|nr:DUF5067 domain-containing protein [Ruminococcus sp.]